MINLKSSQVSKLETIARKLDSLSLEFEDSSNVSLNFGNGSVSEQLSIARAALDTIFQELGYYYE